MTPEIISLLTKSRERVVTKVRIHKILCVVDPGGGTPHSVVPCRSIIFYGTGLELGIDYGDPFYVYYRR